MLDWTPQTATLLTATAVPPAPSANAHTLSSPARALPPSPSYDNKPKIPSPNTSAINLLSPSSEPIASPSPQLSTYQTPLSTFSPAGPNMDYFSRDRQPSTTSNTTYSTTPPTSSALASALGAKKKPPPPPPPRLPSAQQQAVFVTALYEFGGQGEGDLIFREGDKIKVVKSTESKDDWWVGELRGVRGSFPANYCE